ncbi:MAG: LacI family DNA-binding transcriptional regulator [Spirochaetes bacterium]|nr:LacI family DNA-binding transcriptional regulator [Spirochaetota bacterium]
MATLKELARLSKASIRTVARVVHRKGYVGAKTRERIEGAIAELGYEPDLAARSLRTRRSFEIAVVVPTADEIHMDKLAAAERQLRGAGYRLRVFFEGQGTPPEWKALFKHLHASKPAGVLFLPALPPAGLEGASGLGKAGIPYVLMDLVTGNHPGVRIDRPQGVYEAVRHLIASGRKRIAFVGPGEAQSRSRLAGYRRALEEAGLPAIHLECAPEAAEEVRRLGRELADRPEKIDAVQAYTDQVAMGLLAGLHDAGRTVPREIAVVGFDDRRMAMLAWPPLTTVAQPNREVGEAAAAMLLEWIDRGGGPPPVESRTVPTRLVIRESG